jgi:hypothetical protein
MKHRTRTQHVRAELIQLQWQQVATAAAARPTRHKALPARLPFARGHLARLQIVWPSQRSHFPQVVLALLLASVIALVVWGAQLFQS